MTQGTGAGSGSNNTTERQVIDFNEMRAQKMEEKRRKTERIFFKHLLSVYTVVGDGKRMTPVEIIDISEEGCSFQVPFNPEKPWPTASTDIPLRLYFSQDTYLEIIAKVVNSKPSIENGARFTRYGCQVDKTMSSYVAYQQFVKFMKLYAEHSHKDLGDISVFYL
jgi:hypothetical protein